MKKIRCGGETLPNDKTYTGREVYRLVQISYENGYIKGQRESEPVVIQDSSAEAAKDALRTLMDWVEGRL